MPDIEGLTEKENLVPEELDPIAEDGSEDKRLTYLRILGVFVDHALRWDAHIARVEAKARYKMKCLERINGSMWGLDLIEMRRLYLCNVRTVISYACAVWFVHFDGEGRQLQIRQELIQRLQVLQNSCLRQVAGAFYQTPSFVLHKELYVDPIAVHLQRIAMSHRVRTLGTPKGDRLLALLQRPSPGMRSSAVFHSHPYKKAYDLAKTIWEVMKSTGYRHINEWGRKSRNHIVNLYFKEQATVMSGVLWDDFQRQRNLEQRNDYNARPVAARGKWGDEHCKLHIGLIRAQSTMLIQCRANVIGLNSVLKKVKRFDTDMCPCGIGRHTVSHLFFRCPSLEKARAYLPLGSDINQPVTKDIRSTGRPIPRRPGSKHERSRMKKPEKPGSKRTVKRDLEWLLTERADEATAWAIRHFGIKQFQWTKQHMWFGPSKRDFPLEGT
ncbi:hypothetical protein LY78DRAFT_684241 [Colletotrichum sublineola]|nr:hypothetical protein LY78DRAFT_684241 [Colletotrichum sublineola]